MRDLAKQWRFWVGFVGYLIIGGVIGRILWTLTTSLAPELDLFTKVGTVIMGEVVIFASIDTILNLQTRFGYWIWRDR